MTNRSKSTSPAKKSTVKPARSKKEIDEVYAQAFLRLQEELVHMQTWVAASKARVLVIFEGRDAAGKGGVIKRITEVLNPRVCKVAALSAPSDRERGQWYFQRYVSHLPSPGEIVLFDRSWYNRAGVERVMGFCSQDEVEEFFRSCPEFERMLVRSGIHLVKYWFSVSPQVQEKRFQDRARDPLKQWKLSPIDFKSRAVWNEYSRAKDEMFQHTDIPEAPWHGVEGDNKRQARMNCIAHLLMQIPYKRIRKGPIKLPKQRVSTSKTHRPSKSEHRWVPDVFSSILSPR